jgi:hypothetical protein
MLLKMRKGNKMDFTGFRKDLEDLSLAKLALEIAKDNFIKEATDEHNLDRIVAENELKRLQDIVSGYTLVQALETGALIRLVNLTPHPINVVTADGDTIVIKPEKVSIRVPSRVTYKGFKVLKDGSDSLIRFNQIEFSETEDLPKVESDIIYIVSLPTLLMLQDSRCDLVAPDTDAGAIRDEKGHIQAVLGFVYL